MPIQPAAIRFDDRGNAYSEAFDDIYFNPDQALGKTEHLFHRATRLDEQLAALPPGRPFIVGELGFGLGLNFLGTWAKFKRAAPPASRLHYVAIELAPPSVDQLERALRPLGDWTVEARELIREWPGRVAGVHRLRLDRCELTLHLGDVNEMLGGLQAEADAWFLDGFAPEKNPAMWSSVVAQQLFKRTRPGGRLGSFTAAGHVRRALAEAGFEVERLDGTPFKRHIVSATKPPLADAPRQPITSKKNVAVIGAGWAGLSVADELHRRGHDVVVVDASGPGAGASGNRDAVCAPVLDAAPSPRQDYYRSAFVLASRRHHRCGVLRRPDAKKDEASLKKAAENFGDLDRGFEWRDDGLNGLWMPRAAVAHFPNFADVVIERLPQSAQLWPFAVASLEHKAKAWRLLSTTEQAFTCDAVVLACAASLKSFGPTADWPLTSIRGQVSHVQSNESGTARSFAVFGEAYLCPKRDGIHSVGATFAAGDLDPNERESDHEDNLRRAALTDPAWAASMDPTPQSGRVGFRCSSPDRLPMIGPVPHLARCREGSDTLVPKDCPDPDEWPVWPGLYAATALGSHGVISSALAAALIADAIEGTPPPCSRAACLAVHPGRYLTRAYKRGQPIRYPASQ